MKSLSLNNTIRFFSLLFVLNLFSSATIKAQCDPVGDSLALVAFYNAAGGDEWDDNSNWLIAGQPIGSWYGVFTNSEGCVYKLLISDNNMTGTISPEIGNLTSLEKLSLGNSDLSGPLPPEIGNLSNLKEISLGTNNLNGSIPSEIGNLNALEKINIPVNDFTGEIPPSIGNLINLKYLSLGSNDLSGPIPIEFGNLINLEYLSLSWNELDQSIPSTLGNLTKISYFDLRDNQLSGNLPPELGNLINLEHLLCNTNNLSGIIPSELGNLINLQVLLLNSNDFTGTIPPELSNLLNLETLSVGHNQLTGTIPPSLGTLSSLKGLYLKHNQLTGGIPAEIWNLSNLVTLSLRGNELIGEIPSEIQNLINLKYLDLAYNKMSGVIPTEVGSLSNLVQFFAESNELTGALPSEIGDLSNLKVVDLSYNNITDSIPPELGNLTNLTILWLYHNMLTGSIPDELGNLVNLSILDLSYNDLTGSLPIRLSNLLQINDLFLDNNQLTGCFPPQYSVFCDISYASFYGNENLPGGGDFDAFCIDHLGECEPTILGNIIYDENYNCSKDTLEMGFQNWMVKASSSEGDFYALSDENGKYSMYTNPGEYTVQLIPSLIYWGEGCTGFSTIAVLDTLNEQTVDFFLSEFIECPYLTADISTPLLRRCMDNVYVVNYCNRGTALAENTSVEITFDDFIMLDSTSVTISSQIDNTITFDLGNIDINECGSFKIYTKVSCDATLGQTLCATAHIYPDSICTEIAPEWSGATVEVEGECDGDDVHFTIKNTGEGDMLMDQTYIVIEDGIILLTAPESFSLDSNNDLVLTYPANGTTYICQATQVNNHPVETMPTAFVEACGTNEEGGFSIGYVTQFPEDDNAPFVSIDCQEVIGSYDPNDKRGFPKGYATEHFIARGQDIEYHIRFQNTGTDTAFTVIVEDVLSPNLEITSLRMGASSHPYTLEIQGSDTLRFIFNNILLPDSIINEVGSHGFFKFKISQKPDLPLGVVIENTAAIFFDFNDPILTNTTIHTIGEQFVEVVAVQNSLIPFLNVSVAPNPIVDQAIIRIDGVDFKNAKLSLLNNLGIMFREETFDGNEFLLKKGDLPAGIYFFEIILDGQKGFVGKLIIN